MNISYRFSSPQGDIVANDSMLDGPFAVGPAEYHQFMTLRDFFDAVERFVLSKEGATLKDILPQVLDRDVRSGEIEGITIRYEKYGTFYQICSVDVFIDGSIAKMCASVAPFLLWILSSHPDRRRDG